MARPKRVFTDEEMTSIEQYARNNCYNRTISTALNIPIVTLERRFGTKIRRWRAQGKVDLRQWQRDLAKRFPSMAKFLGTNELGQTDKQVIETEKPTEVPESQKAAYEDAAKTIKLRLSKTSPA